VTQTAMGRDGHELANIRWAEAVRVYRSSLDLYHQAPAMRANRDSGLWRQQPAAPQAVLSTNDHVLAPEAVLGISDGAVALAELTPREREVAALLAAGCTNQQIAERLVLTRGTVANHVAHILYKLGVTNRTQVAALVHHQSVDRT
jgi:DNA-binding NarL/FixJ family response regulator